MTFFHHVQYEELLVVCIMFEVLRGHTPMHIHVQC